MVKPDSPTHDLVAQLPEIYQPIFGYPEYDAHASRVQDRRLEEVLSVYTALARLKGRPLRVLDLGCAQGYFSLSLAKRGATVLGVDYLEANIAVCRQLSTENPELPVTFEFDRIESIVEQMGPDQYDLVLGLSVFHHLIYLHSVEHVQTLLQKVTASGASLLAETALVTEPLYWASAQPSDPRMLFGSIAFVRCLDWYPTHLSDINRPLFFASDDIWYLGTEAVRFKSWSSASHALALDVHHDSRGYYFADGVIAKKFLIEGAAGEANRIELEREGAVLSKELPGFPLPRMLDIGQANGEMWLVREMIGGSLLSEVLLDLDLHARQRILIQVLEQLAALERLGLYHADVRTWNVVLDAQSVPHLIDYGAIGAEPADCVWPHNIHLAALIFAQEVISGEVALSDPLRRAALSPASLAPELSAWAQAMFRKPLSEWSFSEMSSALAKHWAEPRDLTTHALDHELWLSLLEQALQAQLHHAKHLRALIDVTAYDSIKRVESERATAWSDKEEVRLAAVQRMDQLESSVARLSDESNEVRLTAVQRLDHIESSLARLSEEHDEVRLNEVRRMDQLESRLATQADEHETVRFEAAKRMDQLDSSLASHASNQAAMIGRLLAQSDSLQQGVQAAHAAVVAMMRETKAALSEMAASCAGMGEVQRQLRDELIMVRDQLGRADQRADVFGSELATLREEVAFGPTARAIQELQEEIAVIKGSRSWRLTAPLRSTNRRLASAKLGAKIWLRPYAARIARRMIAVPTLRRGVRRLLLLQPRFDERVQRFLRNASLMGTPDIQATIVQQPMKRIMSRRADVLSAMIGLRDVSGKGDS